MRAAQTPPNINAQTCVCSDATELHHKLLLGLNAGSAVQLPDLLRDIIDQLLDFRRVVGHVSIALALTNTSQRSSEP